MKSTRRAFLQLFSAAAVGLTIALPTRTFGAEPEVEAPVPVVDTCFDKPMFKMSAGLDRLIARSMEKRTALGAW